MPSEVKINVEGLTQDVTRLKREMAAFEAQANGLIDGVISELQPFNSDFTNRISRALNNMRDTRVPELQTKLNEYVQSIELAKTTFGDADTASAEIYSP